MILLAPVITNEGVADLVAPDGQGVYGRISHIALGDGGTDLGQGYVPAATQSALVREKVRIPVAGGESIGDSRLRVDGWLDVGPSFWMREVGFVLTTGKFLAIWSDPVAKLGYKTEGIPIGVSYYLKLVALPANAIALQISGSPINLSMAEPFAGLATSLVLTQTHIMQADIDRLSGVIANTWS